VLNSSSSVSEKGFNFDPEEPGRDVGAASTRVLCRGRPAVVVGGKVDVGGGAGGCFAKGGINCSKTSASLID